MNNLKIIIIVFLSVSTALHNSFGKDVLKAKKGIIWDSKNNQYVAEGDVNYLSDDIELFSQYLKASYETIDGKEIFNEIFLDGDVKIIYNEEIYTSENAIYYKKDKIVILKKNVEVASEGRILKGDELIIDLEENTRTMNSSDKDSFVEVFINE
jgi:lipopolysaccharide export system protein LptA